MGELAREVLELVERPWAELDEDEREALGDYVRNLSRRPADVYMFLRYARRRWRRGRTGSSGSIREVKERDPT